MNYIQEIRNLVGHRPIIMVGAAVLISNEQGQVLLLRRADNGLWGSPGGALEPGESLAQAARRETREETGLEVGEMHLFGVFSGDEFSYEYPNGDQVYNVIVVFHSSECQGTPAMDAESTAICYFHPEEIVLEQVSPPVRAILTRYLQNPS